MRVLVLSPKCIWPLTGGAETRNFNLLRQTAKHHDVYYLSFLFSPEERDHLTALQPYCKKVAGIDLPRPAWRKALNAARSCFTTRPYVLYEYLRREMADALREMIAKENIDVVHAHNLHMVQYAPLKNGAAFVYDTHNLDHVLWERFSKIQTNPAKRAFARSQCQKFIHWQQFAAEHSEKIVTLSDGEREEYLRMAPEADLVTVTNGADVEFFQPRDETPELNSIIYFANFEWRPQSDAGIYFHDKILPLVRKKIPGAKLYLVGNKPPEDVRRLASTGVVVTGFVEDIRDYIARAAVVVIPLRVGAGTKHRIFQALAMRKALVTTSVGAEGIALKHGETAMITDDPQQFADYTVQLLNDAPMRARLGENGRKLVLERYDWRSIYLTLDQAFHDAVGKRKQKG
jgi:glycosyltransferase involved in cell wall biosynthesis